jgi:hypothetical protein
MKPLKEYTRAQRLLIGFGVDPLVLEGHKRDPGQPGTEPGNKRHLTRRQRALRLRAMAQAGETPRRKYQKHLKAGQRQEASHAAQ